MIYVGLAILFLPILQLLVAIINSLFPQVLVNGLNNKEPLVSVLIPARNEENNIGNILEDLQNITYKNIEIIVYNDLSTDKTEEIINSFARNDLRVKLIKSNGLDIGWTGKNFACYNLSQHAQGDFFLFLDADVRIKKDIIEKALSRVLEHKLALLSIFPTQEMVTKGEWKVVPLMNYILLSLLPLILIHKSRFVSLAAANGQFMLFDKQLYLKYSPHKNMKNSIVEDIQIARFYKKNRETIACITGESNISCRMYHNYCEAENGFTKNMIYFFGNSYLWAFIFWFITSIGWLVIFISWKLFIVYLLASITTRLLTSKISKQNIWKNHLYMIPQQISMAKILFKSWINKNKKEIIWKDRNVF